MFIIYICDVIRPRNIHMSSAVAVPQRLVLKTSPGHVWMRLIILQFYSLAIDAVLHFAFLITLKRAMLVLRRPVKQSYVIMAEEIND